MRPLVVAALFATTAVAGVSSPAQESAEEQVYPFRDVAEEAGISLRSMQRIEAEGTASLQSRAAIATAFEIEPIELEVEKLALFSLHMS